MSARTVRFVLAPLVLILVAMLCRAYGDEAEDQYRVAAGHYARGQWDLADDEFGVFLERFPSHPNVDQGHFFLGEALVQQGRSEEAAKHFAEYLRRAPGGGFARTAAFRVGEAAYLIGRFDEARHELEAFHQAHPGDVLDGYVLGYLGQIALARHDATTAAERFGEALRQSPDGQLGRGCRMGLARSLEKLGKTQEALELYDALTAEGSGLIAAEARFRLGGLQYTRGAYDKAVATLGALDDDPAATAWRPRARLVRALALRKLGQLDQAAALLAELGSDATVEVESQYWLAAVRKDQRQWDAAAKMLLAAAQKHPDHRWIAAIRFHAGHALLMAGRPAEAATQFDLVLDRSANDDPWLDDAAMGKIQVALAEKDPAAVDRQAEQFLKRFPKSPLTSNVRRAWAGSLLARGENARAVELLENFSGTAPTDDSAVATGAQLAVGLARLGKWDEAKTKLTSLLAEHADHTATAPAIEQMAEAAYAAGNWPAAAEWFTWLAGREGPQARVDRAISGLAWTQFKQGCPAEAAATFQRLVDRKPEPRLAVRTAWARGYVLEQAGQLDAALAAYETAIDRLPRTDETTQVMLAAAGLHGRRQQPEKAAVLYERLANEKPAPAELDAILYQWAGTLSGLARSDEAAAVLARLHEQFPKSRYGADAAYQLARRGAAAGNRTTARRLVEEILAAKASPAIEPFALALACQVDAADERWDDVARSAQRLLDEHPESSLRVVAEFWVAESLYRRADYEAAAAKFETLAPEIKNCRETWMALVPMRRAQILAIDNKWNEAYGLASNITRDFPGFDRQYEVDYLLGRALAARAEFDAAREAYRRVIASPGGAKTETAAMAQWMIGETYFHQENHAAAVREYLRVEILYDFPRWQAAALLQAGKCYEQLDRADEAAKLYRRVASDYPVSPFVEEAKGRLSAAARGTDAREARRPAATKNTSRAGRV